MTRPVVTEKHGMSAIWTGAIVLAIALLVCLPLHACGSPAGDQPKSASEQPSAASSASSLEGDSKSGEVDGVERRGAFDPYATENVYDIDGSLLERHSDVDYGRLDKDVEYYSSTAGDTKRCNVLLPAGYDEGHRYPVMYVIHGFGGSYDDLVNDDSYLVTLYGNMLAEGLAKHQIIVGVDMYTDLNDDKADKTSEELRFIYDKVVDDIALDLMPFVKSRYSVDDKRESTAVAGLSQGASESLCTGFKWLDKIGYIAAFAPDSGVIPTEYFVGTFWNVPYFEEFPQPDSNNTPLYLYMNVGTEDPWNVDCTLYYSEVLNGMGVRNQTDLVPGRGHDSGLWQLGFYNFLAKTFR